MSLDWESGGATVWWMVRIEYVCTMPRCKSTVLLADCSGASLHGSLHFVGRGRVPD